MHLLTTQSHYHQEKMHKILNFLSIYSTHPKLSVNYAFTYSKFLLIFKIQFHQYEMLRYGLNEKDLTKVPNLQ